MKASSGAIEALVDALRCLPGVGPKSARRMAYHLLERDREGASRLSTALSEAVTRVGRCGMCRTLSESELCGICGSGSRDASLLCVVETPSDLNAIEQGTGYRGRYFVLMGQLSPLDGIGPSDIGLDVFEQRLGEEPVQEIIIATSSTVEGQATAHYIAEIARERGIQATRLAQGIPLGGELEYVDSGTLAHAFSGRQTVRG
ncbi:MAG: recombination protein RecR [Gammaproteobacteria bacterium]|nr:recombination protein RecR [Gammaproteobacteria bacterium]